MALLEILTLPDPRLKIKSEAVVSFDKELQKFVKDMQHTMTEAQGIGLAAVQVGVHKRIVILDLGDLDMDEDYIEEDPDGQRILSQKKGKSQLEVYINPVIVESSEESEYEEGCLSIPGIRSIVKRKKYLTVKFFNVKGEEEEIKTEGLRSIALQHEIDHCDGIVFTDRLSPMQRTMILKKYEKLNT